MMKTNRVCDSGTLQALNINFKHIINVTKITYPATNLISLYTIVYVHSRDWKDGFEEIDGSLNTLRITLKHVVTHGTSWTRCTPSAHII